MSAPASPGVLGGLVRRFFGSAVSTAAGYGIGGAIQPTLEPLTQDLATTTWSAHRVRPLAAAIAASLWLRGLMDEVDAKAEAGLTGIDEARAELLRRAAGSAPPLETLLALRRRGVIGEGALDDGIAQLGYLPQWRAHVKRLQNVVPSVTDLVHMAVREVFNPALRAELDLDAELPGAFVERARSLGIDSDLAADYWADHWQLPSYEQLAQMMFRAGLSPAAFSNALKALDYAPTWRDRLEAIARPIPPLSDMVRFAVRDVYSPATVARFGLGDEFPGVFAEQAALHGMEPPYPQQYWAAHWRLPSALQGYRMLWRDELSPGELDDLLKALDYPPFFRRKLANIAHLVPGRIDLKRMLRHDVKNRDEVKAGYMRLGYTEPDAESMTQIAEAELGDTTAAETYVGKARTSLWNRLHTEYVSRQLTADEVTAGLAQVGVPVAQRGRVVTLWTAEQGYVRTELTQAQIVKAYWKGLYTIEEATAELAERGVAAGDIPRRIEIGKPAS